jgi:autotransporter-associated beta strand protein
MDATGTGSSTLTLGASQSIASLTGAASSSVILASHTLTMGDATSSTTYAGGISGTGALVKDDASTQILSGTNTYTGGTTINAGTLSITGGSALADTGTVSFADASGAVLSVSTSETIGSLSGGGASGGNIVIASGQTLTVNQAANTTFSGAISGANLVKTGSGTLTVNGSNTYTGTTTVNSGTLTAASSTALGGNTTVQIYGGSLLVTADDAINGKNITLASTATGSAAAAGLAFSGTYNGTAGSLTLNADSIIDLGTDSVALHFSNMAMGIYNLAIYNWTGTTLWGGGTGNNTDQFYVDRTVSDNELNRISFYSGISSSSFVGTGFQLSGGSFNQEIIPVPEPEVFACAILILLGYGIFCLRRARHRSLEVAS